MDRLAALLPLDGARQVLSLEGRVPQRAQNVILGIRVGTEGALPGAVDLRLHEISYSDGGDVRNRVRNARFRRGLEDWETYGEGRVSTPANDDGAGRVMRIVTRDGETVAINSTGFAVSPGSPYRLEVTARTLAAEAGRAYIAAIFLADTESWRDILSLAPAPISLATLASEPDGALRLSHAGIEPGCYQLVLEYAGDAAHWPARGTGDHYSLAA